MTTLGATLARRPAWLRRPRRLTWDGVFIFLLAGLTTLFILLSTRIHVFLAGDAITQYSQEVVALLNGQGIQAFKLDSIRGPLFPALVASIAWLLRGDVFVAGQVVEVAAYALFLVAVFGLVRANWDARLAVLVVISVGACTPVLMDGLSWLTDNLFAALVLLSLLCMYPAGRRWAWMSLAAGLLAGLAFDTRWNGAFLLGVALLAAVLNPWQIGLAQRLRWLAIFGLGFLLAAGPFLAINTVNYGSPFFNHLNQVPMEKTLVSPRLGPSPSLKDLILVDPAFFFTRYFQRLAWDGLLQVGGSLPLILALFMPAGAFVLLRGLNRRKLLLLGFTGLFWSVAALTHFEPRYYFPMLPLLLVLPWVFWLSDAVPDIRLSGSVSLKLCLLGVILIGVSAGQVQAAFRQSGNTNASFQPQLDVAKMLADLPAGSVKGTQVATEYYSGARYFIPHVSGLPVGFLKAPAGYLQPPVDYSHILAEEGVPQTFDPKDFFDPLLVGPQLEAMYYKSEKPRVVLYQIIPGNQVWPLQTINVSASQDAGHGPAAVLDTDAQTGWLTPPSAAPDASAVLVADLGMTVQMDRIWLLPPANPVLFPVAYQVDVSADGALWTPVASVNDEPLNPRQNPRAFAFDTQTARFVRFTAVRLRAGPAGQYQAGLNGIRVSLTLAGQPAAP